VIIKQYEEFLHFLGYTRIISRVFLRHTDIKNQCMNLYNGHNLLFFTGIYCCAVFCLIGISIVETIFVNYLKVKAANRGSVETTSTVTGQDGKS